MTFNLKDEEFVDDKIGTIWSTLGEGIEGEMAGETLTPIVHGNHF